MSGISERTRRRPRYGNPLGQSLIGLFRVVVSVSASSISLKCQNGIGLSQRAESFQTNILDCIPQQGESGRAPISSMLIDSAHQCGHDFISRR